MEKFSPKKFVQGFNIFNWRTLAKVIWAAVISSLCIGVNSTIGKLSNNQQVDTIEHQIIVNEPPSIPIGGCSFYRLRGDLTYRPKFK